MTLNYNQKPKRVNNGSSMFIQIGKVQKEIIKKINYLYSKMAMIKRKRVNKTILQSTSPYYCE